MYSNKEYYCRLFSESLFLHMSFKFHSNIGTMHMCAPANTYSKFVNSKCLRVIMLLYASAYITEFSRKKNENIYDGVRF